MKIKQHPNIIERENKKKLKKFDESFLKIFDFNPVGMIISNLETTRFQYVNEVFLSSFAYTRAEVIGKTAIELGLIESESNEKVLSLLLQYGFAKDIEVLGKKKNGETFWTLASVQVITINDQKIAITSFLDINERKKAEDELIIANKKLVFQNEEKAKRAAELVVANRELCFQNKEKEKRAAELVIANKELVKSQKTVRKLNEGLEDTIDERTSELVNSNKIILDYKFALDESCIVAVTDQKGTIQFVNDNFCKISKYGKDELIGQDHRIINSDYHSKEFMCSLWSTISKGIVWKGEIKNKAKDGTIYWVDTTIVPFLNEEGKPYKYLAIRSDITQRKNVEENIIKLNDALETKVKERTLKLTDSLLREKELNELKTRFVSFASHEFRTPLASILSSSSLIGMYNNPEQGEQRLKHINRISSSVNNLTDILNDFLTHGELEQGVIEIISNIFDLPEFIMKVVEGLNGIIDEKNQKIIYQHNGEPMIEQSGKILRNILLNLLSNASKYSSKGKVILLTSSIANNVVSISVKDYGIGIPDEDQKKLFEQFFRAGNVENIQGTGLGLAIVKKYVELINGNIKFISKPGEGTTFTIEFPQKNRS